MKPELTQRGFAIYDVTDYLARVIIAGVITLETYNLSMPNFLPANIAIGCIATMLTPANYLTSLPANLIGTTLGGLAELVHNTKKAVLPTRKRLEETI